MKRTPQFWTNSNIGSQLVLSRQIIPSNLPRIPSEVVTKSHVIPFLRVNFLFFPCFFGGYSMHIYIYDYTCVYVCIYICIQYTVYSIYRKREQERVYYNPSNIPLNVESWLPPFKSQVRPPLCGSRHLFFGSSRARSSSTTWRQGARATTSTSERLRILKNFNVGKTMPLIVTNAIN